MTQAVVFDMDDTLYPEIEFVYSGFLAVSNTTHRELGIEIYEDLLALFESGQRGDLFTPVLKKRGYPVDESYVLRLVSVYRGHKPKIKPFPESESVLEKLKCSFRLGIISDGIYDVQKRKFEALNLAQYFESVIFTDKWGREYWKPHSRPFQESAMNMSVDIKSMVYVGDNPTKDFIGCRKLNMKTIRVRRSGTLNHNVSLSSEYEADCETDSLESVITML